VLENIVVVFGILAFLILAVFVGRGINRLKHWKYVRVWQPLIPIIGGTVHEDPLGGGASIWLVG
jgi:hypothetical protein